jgi:hypothetical protein
MKAKKLISGSVFFLSLLVISHFAHALDGTLSALAVDDTMMCMAASDGQAPSIPYRTYVQLTVDLNNSNEIILSYRNKATAELTEFKALLDTSLTPLSNDEIWYTDMANPNLHMSVSKSLLRGNPGKISAPSASLDRSNGAFFCHN